MILAMEVRAGNVIMVGKDPMVVQRAEYNKGGRNCRRDENEVEEPADRGAVPKSSTRRTTNSKTSSSNARRRRIRISPIPMYVFMDSEYNQHEVEKDNMGDALNYLDDGLPCEIVFYDDKPISVTLPNSVVREITTEPAVRGDTSGKVLKPAKIGTGFVVNVPLFCEIGDKIEIDTRTGEYRNRVKG